VRSVSVSDAVQIVKATVAFLTFVVILIKLFGKVKTPALA
jgi:hypothetical protein